MATHIARTATRGDNRVLLFIPFRIVCIRGNLNAAVAMSEIFGKPMENGWLKRKERRVSRGFRCEESNELNGCQPVDRCLPGKTEFESSMPIPGPDKRSGPTRMQSNFQLTDGVPMDSTRITHQLRVKSLADSRRFFVLSTFCINTRIISRNGTTRAFCQCWI
jgi:hypothetical protein